VQSTLTLPILAGDRVTATEAPRQLQASAKISTAVGVICAQLDVDEDEARRLLRDAAACAGASELRVAEALLSSWEDLDDSSDR
jgi:AmiR/NasT family two-component response regulator